MRGKRILKTITAMLLSAVFVLNSLSVVKATVADYYDPGFVKVGGAYVNKSGAPIPGVLKRGIDVSFHQGSINWGAVKQSDVGFAMIRAGSFKSGLDPCFHQNMTGALGVGIPVGIYVYSYATTPEMAVNEALFAISVAKDYPVSYPICYDIEDAYHKEMTPAQLQNLVNSFCNTITAAGYYPMVYSSRNWFTNRIGPVSHEVWVAQYADACTYPGKPAIWQCTSHGQINGIQGRVDIDMQFKDFSALIPANGFKKQAGKTFYMENYKMHRGLLVHPTGTYYFEPLYGVMQTGLANTERGLCYFGEDGKMQTGVVKIGDFNFYFNPETGAVMPNAQITVNKKNYITNEVGAMIPVP